MTRWRVPYAAQCQGIPVSGVQLTRGATAKDARTEMLDFMRRAGWTHQHIGLIVKAEDEKECDE